MLILPIVNRGRVLNVAVRLKDSSKIRTGIRFSDASESEVIVNGKLFSTSIYKDDKSPLALIEFIRNNSIRLKRNFIVTTREESDSTTYDVYEVALPPVKVSEGLDKLYVSLITDMRKEIPYHDRGRYLSFSKLGLNSEFSDDKIERLEFVVNNIKDSSQWPMLFRREGVMNLVETLDYLKCLECTSKAEMPC